LKSCSLALCQPESVNAAQIQGSFRPTTLHTRDLSSSNITHFLKTPSPSKIIFFWGGGSSFCISLYSAASNSTMSEPTESSPLLASEEPEVVPSTEQTSENRIPARDYFKRPIRILTLVDIGASALALIFAIASYTLLLHGPFTEPSWGWGIYFSDIGWFVRCLHYIAWSNCIWLCRRSSLSDSHLSIWNLRSQSVSISWLMRYLPIIWPTLQSASPWMDGRAPICANHGTDIPTVDTSWSLGRPNVRRRSWQLKFWRDYVLVSGRLLRMYSS